MKVVLVNPGSYCAQFLKGRGGVDQWTLTLDSGGGHSRDLPEDFTVSKPVLILFICLSMKLLDME